MKPINWISEKIISSVASLIGGLIISKAESETLKHQMNTLDELEETARQYESDGKLHLAQLLRDKISILSSSSPGQVSAQIAEGMQDNRIAFLESTAVESKQPGNLIGEATTEKRKRGRPKKTIATPGDESDK